MKKNEKISLLLYTKEKPQPKPLSYTQITYMIPYLYILIDFQV
jgi:hypothetical protein